jgi:hypothetical protein
MRVKPLLTAQVERADTGRKAVDAGATGVEPDRMRG